MKRLEIFKGEYRKMLYMPDDVFDVDSDYGTSFYVERPTRCKILNLPKDWGWVWLDALESGKPK